MSSGHDHHDNHSSEPKTVSFRTPMILALVTVLIIVLAVSTCDNKPCCEDGTKCEQEAGGHSEHGGHETTGHEEHMEKQDEAAHETSEHGMVADSIAVKADTAAVKTEEHAAAAHH
jgi:hypothetical protein